MNVSRRRFLAIAASFAAAPAMAQRSTWTGRAFGAEASIDLHGPAAMTGPALDAAQALIKQVEGLFSLYDPRVRPLPAECNRRANSFCAFRDADGTRG